MGSSNLEILAYEATPLGVLCLRRRRLLSRPDVVVTEITLDNEFLMSSYLTESERALASHALDMHAGRALEVLVGGLGLGYTAHAVLASDRVAHVEVVEYLPPVIQWLQQGLFPLAGPLQSDARFSVVQGDVYGRLSDAPTKTYDVILIDVDHSADEHLGSDNADFYTGAGLRRAQRHLGPGGILAVWSYAEHSPFATALRAVFREVHVVPITVMNDLVDEEQTDWLFLARA